MLKTFQCSEMFSNIGAMNLDGLPCVSYILTWAWSETMFWGENMFLFSLYKKYKQIVTHKVWVVLNTIILCHNINRELIMGAKNKSKQFTNLVTHSSNFPLFIDIGNRAISIWFCDSCPPQSSCWGRTWQHSRVI